MKVLHVIARMNVGGTANYVSKLVSEIPGSLLVCGNVQGAEIEDPILNSINFTRISVMGRRIDPLNDLRSLIQLRKIIRDFNPDVVHSHTFKAGLLARLIRGKFKRIHTFHGHLLEDESFSFLKIKIILKIETILARKTDILVSVGKRVADELKKQGVGLSNKWVSIPPGIEPIAKIDKNLARMNLGILSKELIVGWYARMAPVKNPYLFLEVASMLPQSHFVMGGGGELLEEIKDLAPRNVQVLGWTNPIDFLSAMDILVSTSKNEGMPIALIEAQSAYLPVVATDVGSTNEVILDNESGYLTSNFPSEIAAKIKYIMENKDSRNRMGTSAHINSVNKFTTQVMINEHIRLYSSLK